MFISEKNNDMDIGRKICFLPRLVLKKYIKYLNRHTQMEIGIILII